MHVAIAGGHGKIALSLTERLIGRGDRVTSLIRNPDHAGEIEALGATPVTCDLEHASQDEIAAAAQSAEAVVFAAGAGPGSGAERKVTMDRDGAIKLLEATAAARARYVIVSSVGAEDPPGDDDVFSVYLRAKAEADRAVMETDRDWVVVRPGALTDGPGTGMLRIDVTPYRASVARDDVAELLALVLHDDRAVGRILYANAGDTPIEKALAEATSA